MLALLLASMPVLGYAAPENPPIIPPADAAQHVGELVIAQNVVDQVSVSSRNSTTYLNFGGRYPNHTFAAASSRRSRRSSRTCRGRRVDA